VLPYYPDQLTSYFAFELADSLLSAVRNGSAVGVLGGFLRLQDTLPAYRWSPLLTNHDAKRTMSAIVGGMDRAKLAATLLLTLPGMPYVYYGEEIGMTGDKPDERLRTPMQWKPAAGTGFTTGTPWSSAQPDSMTTTVEAQEADSGSLLNLYRRLIHFRKANDALAVGRLIPLTANNTSVAAYLRREGDETVLVVANLAGEAVSGALIGSLPEVLPPGRYEASNLLSGPDGTELVVGSDGSLGSYAPLVRALGPRESLVLRLVRR
jgi:alpha-amylase